MAPAQQTPQGDDQGRLHYADLGATVHIGEVDATLALELPELYSSCFSVREYFDLYDRPSALHACELTSPRHVLLFDRRGHTVDVLNKVIDIEPESVERFAHAIYRAFPGVLRIRAEVKFPPQELRVPVRELLRADDYVIDLPATLDEYRQGLGSSTRRNLNKYVHQLERLHPGFHLEPLEKTAIPFDIVAQTVLWNSIRLRTKGRVSIFEREPERVELLWRLLQTYGVALCGFDGDRCVAVHLMLQVGRDWWAHTAGFSRDYEDVHLGLLMACFALGEGIERGCTRMHLTWGTPVYKERLRAVPVPAWRVSLFRAPVFKLAYAREAWHEDEPSRIYWRWRKRAKRAAVAVTVAGPLRRRAARPKGGV